MSIIHNEMAEDETRSTHQANQTSMTSSVASSGVSRRLPRLLIIGVRKGGTRALLEMLNLHPNIAMVPVEVHYFDKIENYQRGLEWYRSQMPLSTDSQLTVEKSPSYYVTPEVPERVWAMNPHVQLVLIVRDPVTRLLSDFAQIEASRAAQGLPNRRFQVSTKLVVVVVAVVVYLSSTRGLPTQPQHSRWRTFVPAISYSIAFFFLSSPPQSYDEYSSSCCQAADNALNDRSLFILTNCE